MRIEPSGLRPTVTAVVDAGANVGTTDPFAFPFPAAAGFELELPQPAAISPIAATASSRAAAHRRPRVILGECGCVIGIG